MGYRNLENTLKAIALTVPAARAFELTVEFVLGEGKDSIDRMKADPETRKCIEDRYLGPERTTSRCACARRTTSTTS